MRDHISDKIERYLDSQPSLRDQFAMAALQGPITHHLDFNQDNVKTQCIWAYKYADAMLAAREQKHA